MSVETRPRPVRHRLEQSLEAWQRAGLIDQTQADAIRGFEMMAATPMSPALPVPDGPGTLPPDRRPDAWPAATAASTRRIPVVAEALGYLGGILGVVGAVLLTARYWDTMSTSTRLGVAAAACVVLMVGGVLVPRRAEPALERLRSFLWFGATAAGGLAGGVFVHDVVLDADQWSLIVLGGAAVVALLSLVLWWQHDRPVQQATFMAGLLVTVGTLAAQAVDTPIVGLVVWVTATTMLAVGVAHATTSPWITVGVGAVGTIIGAGLTSADGPVGPTALFWLLTATTLLALAMLEVPVRSTSERVVLYVVGAAGALQSVAPAIAHFGNRAGIATGAVVMAVGIGLLAVAPRPLIRAQLTAQVFAGLLLVGGAAITGMQSPAVATTLGLATAATLIALGTMPGQVLMSVFGCLGLLINVPWAIGHFFPGEGRAPLLIAVSGMLIVLVAVWLSHQGGELRHQFRRHRTSER